MVEDQPLDISNALDTQHLPYEHEDSVEFVNEIQKGDDPDEILNQHISAISDVNMEAALERLTLAHTVGAITSAAQISDDGLGLPPAQHNYLIGLLMAHGTESGNGDLTYYGLSGPISNICLKRMFSEENRVSVDASDEEKFKSQVKFTLQQQIYGVGNFLMSEQPIEAAKRAYSPHNKYLKQKLGFTIEEAIECVEHIESALIENRQKILNHSAFDLDFLVSDSNTMESMWEQFEKTGELKMGAKSKDFRRDSAAIEKTYTNLDEYTKYLSISPKSIRNDLPDGISLKTLNSVIDRLSATAGHISSNPNFRWPYQFNPVSKTPIIEHSGRLYVPNGNALRSALMNSLYYDLLNIEGYGNPGGSDGGEFGRIYGDYLEDWTCDCFTDLLSEERVHKNPLYLQDGFPEACDVLVEGDSTLFVVECKTAKLPIHVRTGSFEDIRNEIELKIGNGYRDQALPLIRKLRDGQIDKLGCNGQQIELSSFDRYQPVLVIGEQYDGVATHLIDRIFEVDDVSPYVVDIYDLQILLEFFDSIREVEQFVDSRIGLFDQRTTISPDEIDYIGLYHENDGQFPDLPENSALFLGDMTHIVGSKIDYKYGY